VEPAVAPFSGNSASDGEFVVPPAPPAALRVGEPLVIAM
jgi:hypothetical protein